MRWSLPLAGGRTWSFNRTQVVGILNATPDSFSDGGALASEDHIVARVRELQEAGVDAFDVGGESTRPGHEPVPADEEIERVVPVIQIVRREAPGAIISIDTQKANVAQAALAAGADWVNDVSGMADPNMHQVLLDAGCSIVLMRHKPLAGNALASCKEQLAGLLARAGEAGLPRARVVLDPGLGFGERPGPDVADNLELLDGIHAYADGLPVMIGHSRKRFVAAMAKEQGLELDAMTGQLCRRAADAGAAMVRVHDVESAVRALQ